MAEAARGAAGEAVVVPARPYLVQIPHSLQAMGLSPRHAQLSRSLPPERKEGVLVSRCACHRGLRDYTKVSGVEHPRPGGDYNQTSNGPGKRERGGSNDVFGFLVTDGGFACECASWNSCAPAITIFNPLMGKRIMRLPDIPHHCAADSADGILHLVADELDDSFKVFWIHLGYDRFERRVVHDPATNRLLHFVMLIFDSTTGAWRSASNPPVDTALGVGNRCHSVTFQGRMYVLFASYAHGSQTTRYRLCRYDIRDGVWDDMGVHFQEMRICDEHTAPKLVVSDGRLFLQSWMDMSHGAESFSPSFCVREINFLADRAHVVVFEMTRALVQLMFHVDEMICPYGSRILESIQVFGSGRSLILRSESTGIIVAHDVVRRSWDRLPRNPMEPLGEERQLWNGLQTMTLRLPSRRRGKLTSEAAPSSII